MIQKIRADLVMVLVFAMILNSCGGGGGDDGTPTDPVISSLSTNSAMPSTLLIITGSGFDATADLSVSFFDGNGFMLKIPVLLAASTSVTVAVPPYINPSTGIFGPGTVNVQLIQNSNGSVTTSNTVQNFQLQDLPTPVAAPGAVTLNTLNGIIAYDYQLQGSIKGSLLDTPGLNAAIANNIADLQALVAQIQAVYQNPSTTVTLGRINGIDVVIDVKALLDSDRMIIGMFKSLSSTSGSASVSVNNSLVKGKIFQQADISCQQEADGETNYLLHGGGENFTTDTNRYVHLVGCKGHELPDEIKKATLKIAGTGTVAIGGFGLLGAPAIALALPGAALLNASVMSIGIQLNVAAALKNSNEAAAYKAIHQAFDETESMLSGLLLGLVIPQTVGFIKDIYTGSSDFIEDLLSTATLVPPPTPSYSTYSGPFSGTGYEGYDCDWWKDDIYATITIAVSGSGTLIDPYKGTMQIGGSIVITLVQCCENGGCDPGGTFAFSGTGAVSGSTGLVEAVAYGTVGEAEFIAIFTGGTFSGNTLSGACTLSFSNEGESISFEKNVTLTK